MVRGNRDKADLREFQCAVENVLWLFLAGANRPAAHLVFVGEQNGS